MPPELIQVSVHACSLPLVATALPDSNAEASLIWVERGLINAASWN